MHVDDFVIGIPRSPVGQKNLDEVRALYSWGSWETGFITQRGSEYAQPTDGAIIQSLAKAAQKVEYIELTKEESKLKG